MDRRLASLAVKATALVVLAIIGGLGCAPAVKPPSVVLLTVDALNADHLSCYGSERVQTPAIDRLAADGVRFTEAWSTSSWTAPAMASLFSGEYSRTHGVRRGFFSSQTLEVFAQEPLADSVVTLAERFRQLGYATAGVSTNPHLREATGFRQGFDQFVHITFTQRVDPQAQLTDEMIERVVIDAETTTERALELVQQIEAGRPFFLWVHYLDPHWPYFPRHPWIDDYWPHYGPPEAVAQATDPLYGKDIVRQRDAFSIEAGSEILDYLMACYDSEVSATDRAVGELLERLPDAETAVVVLTADHGEAFLQHDTLGHRNNLHREEIRIPLILRLPGGQQAGEVRHQPVSLLDLYPTLLELAGDAPERTDTQPGRSLLATSESPRRDVPVFSELTDLDGSYQVAVGAGRHKLIVPCADCDPELYDLDSDPTEHADISTQQAADRRRLETLLGDWFTAIPWRESAAPVEPVDPEIQRQLRALGYLTN